MGGSRRDGGRTALKAVPQTGDNGGCINHATLGKFKTSSGGDGNRTFISSTFGHQSFFIDANDGTNHNDSVTVKVKG